MSEGDTECFTHKFERKKHVSSSNLVKLDTSEQDINCDGPLESVVSPLMKLLRRNIKKEEEKQKQLDGMIELSRICQTSKLEEHLKTRERNKSRMNALDEIQSGCHKQKSKSINFLSEYKFKTTDDQKSINLDLHKLPEIKERRESSNVSPPAR
jgi:hypothetical protein